MLILLQSTWRRAWTAGIRDFWKPWKEKHRFFRNVLMLVSLTS
jgi:hypothetical protein